MFTQRMSALPWKLALAAVGLSLMACKSTTHPKAVMVWTYGSPDPRVVNLTQASFAPHSGVRPAVLAECNLDRKIPQQIAWWAPVPVVLAERAEGSARVLRLEVTDIFAPGGGKWSGPKSVTLHGDMIENGVVTASFDAQRTTIRGFGTCDMLDVIADALARDIRPWIAAPRLGSRLGELH
jgi:hypothetical protein